MTTPGSGPGNHVHLPHSVRDVLPEATARAWTVLAPHLPHELYLAGGTAIAVHLQHRQSRDLDFFYHRGAVDLDEVAVTLGRFGTLAVATRTSGTLNGTWDDVRIQFLHADEARPQRPLDPPDDRYGLRVAGLRDLVAMKLQAVAGRGEMRDYFDLMRIEQRTEIRMETGLAWWRVRYGVARGDARAFIHVVRALGYLADVADDPLLPYGASAETRTYWADRGPELLLAVGRR